MTLNQDEVNRLNDELDHLLGLFSYDHLPPHLRDVSRPFHRLAHQMRHDLQIGYELVAGLRKLVEAKDCFVRAAL